MANSLSDPRDLFIPFFGKCAQCPLSNRAPRTAFSALISETQFYEGRGMK